MGDLIPVCIDLETHMPPPGCITPKLVCGSWRELGGVAHMATRDGILKVFRDYLVSPVYIIVGANICFDLAVAANEDPSLIPLIFAALDAGRISDVAIRQALIDIAEGLIFKDRTKPTPGGYAPLKGRYSVEYLARYYLGLDLSHEKNDPTSPRKRFSEMDGLPLEAYPKEFSDYSLADADHELAIWLAQEGGANLEREPEEVQAAWSLYLMSVRGIRTDKETVEKLSAELEAKFAAQVSTFVKAGIYKIIPCKMKPLKEGQSERVREIADNITAETFKLVPVASRSEAWFKTAERAFAAGKPLRFGEDTKTLERLVTEAYLGNPPLSDKGNIRCNRDTLIESGNDLLEEYGESTNTVKLLKTYLPILRQGIYIPVNAKFNVLVDSLRTSGYDPNLQNLPK